MPKPRSSESKDDYIQRCIPILVKEGKPQDQAVAICYSMWKQKNENTLIEKYIGENIDKAKKELAFLKKSEKMKKITDAGKKRKEKLEDYLVSKGIFD